MIKIHQIKNILMNYYILKEKNMKYVKSSMTAAADMDIEGQMTLGE